ncbi:hypothetical protein [Moritella viscosa]|uniref:Possible muconate cycloisomerase n=1 Tax=Moritella viscosa TaxID=80854 RepID=A0A1K9ZT89_9GAMM|nr:hypothetical protein [Moritella viscosa]SGY99840.1 Possible muconate cycloisomerase [Moritella viscosa]
MNVALSKLILIFSFVSKSTLAAGSNYKLADLPDFHRDDGYGDMLQSEYVTSTPINRPHDELLALGTSDRIYSQLHEIRVAGFSSMQISL